MTGEFDDLFNIEQGGRSWITNRTDEELEWLHSVAKEAATRNQIPVWKKVQEAFAARFGVNRTPKAASTISLHLSRLIEEQRDS